MVNVLILKKASHDLNNLDNKQVVKVAGVIERLRSWYQSLWDPEYREQLQKLRSESSVVKVFLDELSKYIDTVNAAVSNGDIDTYNYALEQVKVISRDLAKELGSYSDVADAATAPEEARTPDLGKIESVYFTQKMRDLPRLHQMIAAAFVKAGFSNEEAMHMAAQPALYDTIEQAIKNGHIVGSRAARPGKGADRPDRQGELWVDIQTPVFQVPNYPASVQMVVEVTDMSVRTADQIPRMAVKWIKKIEARKTAVTAASHGVVKNAGEVKYEMTLVGQVEFAKLIVQALKSLGIPQKNITAQLVGVIWAQAVMESGRTGKGGQVRLRNNNVGGITAGNYDRKWNQGGWLKGNRPYIRGAPTKEGRRLRFKAFATPLEGMKEYVKTLMYLYPQSLLWKMSGMPMQDAAYLKTRNYYGNTPLAHYGGAMDSMFGEFMSNIYPHLKGELANDPRPPPEDPGKYPLPSGYRVKSGQFGWQGQGVSPTEPTGPGASNLQTGTTMAPKPAAPTGGTSEIEELGSYLGVNLAMPLTNIITKALADVLLEKSVMKIGIDSANDYSSKVEYACVLSDALERTIDADVDIYTDGKDIELTCEVTGGKAAAKCAAVGIADVVSLAFTKKYGVKARGRFGLDTQSKMARASELALDRERRKFILKRVG